MTLGSNKWLAIFSAATNVLLLVPSLYMLQLYERVLSSGSRETLLYITLIALAAMVLFGAAEVIRDRLAQMASARFCAEHGQHLFAAAMAGKAPNAIKDFETVRHFMGSRAFVSLFDLPFTPLFIFIMGLLHPTIGLLALGGCVVMMIIGWLGRKSAGEDQTKVLGKDKAAASYAQSAHPRASEMRALGLLPSVRDRWNGMLTDAVNSRTSLSQNTAFYTGLSRFFRKALQIIIMGWGAWLVLEGHVSGGVIFAASMLTGRVLQPIEQLISNWDRIVNARDARKRIEDCLENYSAHSEKIPLKSAMGAIVATDLGYVPDPDNAGRYMLKGVSFKLPPGRVLVINGPAGSGKSTLARLIAGALDPSTGSLKLDGLTREQWPEEVWQSSVGYLPQDVVLFPGTVLENITRFSLQPDEDLFANAVKRSGIHSVVAGLPNGYRTVIGPDKVDLSAGQRKQLGFARAIYANPQLLILDEPNTCLDPAAEKTLVQTLTECRRAGRTIIIVSNQKSIGQFADFALTLEGGQMRSFEANKKQPDTSQLRKTISAMKGSANGEFPQTEGAAV